MKNERLRKNRKKFLIESFMDDPFDEHSNKDTFFGSTLTTFEAINKKCDTEIFDHF